MVTQWGRNMQLSKSLLYKAVFRWSVCLLPVTCNFKQSGKHGLHEVHFLQHNQAVGQFVMLPNTRGVLYSEFCCQYYNDGDA